AGKQNSIAPAHHRAQCGAGAGQLSEVWLRLLAYINADERAQDPLLQVYWLRWLAKTGWPCLRQPPPRSTGPTRPDCLGRGDPPAGRPDLDTTGTRSSAGSSPCIGSDQKTRAESAAGTDTDWQRN